MEDLRLRVFKQWAPADARWSAWAKPVLFAALEDYDFKEQRPTLPDTAWASYVDRNTAIVIDLPGEEAVFEALSLAQRGFRPVPLFNSCRSIGMIVDVRGICEALVAGEAVLAECSLRPDAPPVFILDSRRMESSEMVRAGKFDNRWCVVPQDLPSARLLREAEINKVIVRSDRVRDDLSHILCRYQQEKLPIHISKDGATTEEIRVKTPSLFRSLSYRWGVLLGLKRNSTGGFGAIVPEPWSSGTTMG